MPDLRYPLSLKPNFVKSFTLPRYAIDIGTTSSGVEVRSKYADLPYGAELLLDYQYQDLDQVSALTNFYYGGTSGAHLPFKISENHEVWEFVPCDNTLRAILPSLLWRFSDDFITMSPVGCNHWDFEVKLKNLVGETMTT
jgi:hypothetical protein